MSNLIKTLHIELEIISPSEFLATVVEFQRWYYQHIVNTGKPSEERHSRIEYVLYELSEAGVNACVLQEKAFKEIASKTK